MYEARRALFEVFRVLVLVLVVCGLGFLLGLHWLAVDEHRRDLDEVWSALWDVEQAVVELDDTKQEVQRAAE
jgi:hypothetical protein